MLLYCTAAKKSERGEKGIKKMNTCENHGDNVVVVYQSRHGLMSMGCPLCDAESQIDTWEKENEELKTSNSELEKTVSIQEEELKHAAQIAADAT